jgi:CubicO group peptidase (beta-lactamase class C family)
VATTRGLLALDEPLVARVPEWRGSEREPITLRDLLAHRSGMASGADYRTLFSEDVERFAFMRPLVGRPHERVLYSDLGFIALGTVLARAHERSLAVVVAESLARLGAECTRYRPRNDEPQRIPATECDAWRGRVRGAVHDEKAYLMNGVAGHAGLFGSARDVARLAEEYLAACNGRATALLPVALAREAIDEHGTDPVLRRGLGWALKTSDENSCGARLGPRTFGHTGFTGTVVWADPERDLSIVLLTNAVYFGRHDLRDVRAAVCDAVVAHYAP